MTHLLPRLLNALQLLVWTVGFEMQPPLQDEPEGADDNFYNYNVCLKLILIYVFRTTNMPKIAACIKKIQKKIITTGHWLRIMDIL
jgi:hypothetical protein